MPQTKGEIMKEDEAMEKWCPMARVAYNGERATAANRMWPDVSLETARCIASDCMMWRLDGLYGNTPVSGRLVESGKSDSDGYCGLAGKE